jgi:hypothetical protein
MSKSHIPLALDIRPARSRPGLARIVPVFVAGILLGPLALEGVLCCYAQWCEVIGKSTDVNTPILDTIAQGHQNGREWLGEQVAPTLHRVLREPKIALPVSSILIVVAIALLRR